MGDETKKYMGVGSLPRTHSAFGHGTVLVNVQFVYTSYIPAFATGLVTLSHLGLFIEYITLQTATTRWDFFDTLGRFS